jgi:SNF2 family DNA or RNA helicase
MVCRQSVRALETRFMLLLTGTPIQNNMSELFSIMNLVDEEKFPDLDDFLERFGDPLPTPDQLKDLQVNLFQSFETKVQSSSLKQVFFKLAEHLSASFFKLANYFSASFSELAAFAVTSSCHLWQLLLSIVLLQECLRPILLRRMKEDVETLPEKEEVIIWVELTTLQREYYKSLYEKDIGALLQGVKQSALPGMRNLAMELRKLCCHPVRRFFLFSNPPLVSVFLDREL